MNFWPRTFSCCFGFGFGGRGRGRTRRRRRRRQRRAPPLLLSLSPRETRRGTRGTPCRACGCGRSRRGHWRAAVRRRRGRAQRAASTRGRGGGRRVRARVMGPPRAPWRRRGARAAPRGTQGTGSCVSYCESGDSIVPIGCQCARTSRMGASGNTKRRREEHPTRLAGGNRGIGLVQSRPPPPPCSLRVPHSYAMSLRNRDRSHLRPGQIRAQKAAWMIGRRRRSFLLLRRRRCL